MTLLLGIRGSVYFFTCTLKPSVITIYTPHSDRWSFFCFTCTTSATLSLSILHSQAWHSCCGFESIIKTILFALHHSLLHLCQYFSIGKQALCFFSLWVVTWFFSRHFFSLFCLDFSSFWYFFSVCLAHTFFNVSDYFTLFARIFLFIWKTLGSVIILLIFSAAEILLHCRTCLNVFNLFFSFFLLVSLCLCKSAGVSDSGRVIFSNKFLFFC